MLVHVGEPLSMLHLSKSLETKVVCYDSNVKGFNHFRSKIKIQKLWAQSDYNF